MNDTEILNMVREYIEGAEHRDDWSVPCVYTATLRKMLSMPETKLAPPTNNYERTQGG